MSLIFNEDDTEYSVSYSSSIMSKNQFGDEFSAIRPSLSAHPSTVGRDVVHGERLDACDLMPGIFKMNEQVKSGLELLTVWGAFVHDYHSLVQGPAKASKKKLVKLQSEYRQHSQEQDRMTQYADSCIQACCAMQAALDNMVLMSEQLERDIGVPLLEMYEELDSSRLDVMERCKAVAEAVNESRDEVAKARKACKKDWEELKSKVSKVNETRIPQPSPMADRRKTVRRRIKRVKRNSARKKKAKMNQSIIRQVEKTRKSFQQMENVVKIAENVEQDACSLVEEAARDLSDVEMQRLDLIEDMLQNQVQLFQNCLTEPLLSIISAMKECVEKVDRESQIQTAAKFHQPIVRYESTHNLYEGLPCDWDEIDAIINSDLSVSLNDQLAHKLNLPYESACRMFHREKSVESEWMDRSIQDSLLTMFAIAEEDQKEDLELGLISLKSGDQVLVLEIDCEIPFEDELERCWVRGFCLGCPDSVEGFFPVDSVLMDPISRDLNVLQLLELPFGINQLFVYLKNELSSDVEQTLVATLIDLRNIRRKYRRFRVARNQELVGDVLDLFTRNMGLPEIEKELQLSLDLPYVQELINLAELEKQDTFEDSMHDEIDQIESRVLELLDEVEFELYEYSRAVYNQFKTSSSFEPFASQALVAIESRNGFSHPLFG